MGPPVFATLRRVSHFYYLTFVVPMLDHLTMQRLDIVGGFATEGLEVANLEKLKLLLRRPWTVFSLRLCC